MTDLHTKFDFQPLNPFKIRPTLRTFHCFSDFWIKTVKNMRPTVALGLPLNIFT